MIDEPISYEIINNINHKDFFFVQIGANDGISNDPIRKWIIEYNWSGLMFEPQLKCFQDLKILYENNKNIQTINCGIAKENGKKILYKHSLGSGGSSLLLRKEYCSKDLFEEVDCITFEEMINIYKIKNIDLLVIDTEGYDLQILDSIDFNLIIPKNIWFEKWIHDFDDMNNINFPTSLNKNMHIVNKFTDYGYSFFDYGDNVLLSR